MKIHISDPDGPNLKILIPNALIFNPLCIRFAMWTVKKQARNMLTSNKAAEKIHTSAAVQFTPEQADLFAREWPKIGKSIRKNFGKLVLVDIEQADGTLLKITI